MFRKSLYLAALMAASGASSALAADAKGIWVDDTGRGAIEIKDCKGKLCGHVVWTRDAADSKDGCGKQIIGEVQSVGSGVWDNGWIYSPEEGRKYDVELKPMSDGRLRVKGYMGTKLFSQSMYWTAAPSDLKRCDQPQVEAKAAPAPQPAAPAAIAAQKVEEKVAATESAPVKAAPPAATQPTPPAAAPAPEKPATAAVQPPPAAPEKPAEVAKPADEPAPKAAESQPEPKSNDKKVAQADEDDDDGDLLGKLDGLEFGDGYGVKKLGNGECRLKVPYATITVPCKK